MHLRQEMRRSGNRGFTLIELLIAMVIVGVISAIAIVNYTKSVQKSNRTDAKTALTQIASQEEAYRFSGTGYTTLANLPWGQASQMNLGSQSKNKLYNLTITPAAPSSTYTITATATGGQAKDTDCTTFALNYLGVQSAWNSGGTSNTTSCWGG